MVYERYPRGENPQGDYDNRSDTQDYGRNYTYSSARDYAAAARDNAGRDNAGRDHDDDRDRYGRRDYGNQRYEQRDRFGGGGQQGGGYARGDYGSHAGGRSAYGAQGGYGRQDAGYRDRGSSSEYHGSYASDGRRFEDVGRNRHADDDNYRDRQRQQQDRKSVV